MSDVEVRITAESLGEGGLLWSLDEWRERFPWLVQGITGSGTAAAPFDLGLSGSAPVGEVLDRWEQVRQITGLRRVVHARQVHGAEMKAHGPGEEEGLLIGRGFDGHYTRAADVLLTVSVADCVPVYLVDVASRSIALVHAGWRGVAAGIVEQAVDRLRRWRGRAEEELWVHCGPAICESCYEVGPEVHAQLHPEALPPAGPTPIDLRGTIIDRLLVRGVKAERASRSAHCTRCGPGGFFSHRGGASGRQIAILGLRGVTEPQG